MPFAPAKPVYKLPIASGVTQANKSDAFPAPSKGLDVTTPFMVQDPLTGTVLDNVFVRKTGSELRAGYARWTTNLGGIGTESAVRSVMGYQPPRGVSGTVLAKLFAACEDENIYDVTSQTSEATVPVAAVNIPGQVNPGRFSWVNFSIASTNYLAVVTAGGGYWTYDATGGWVDRTANITGAGATKAINFDFITVWKNRIWFGVNGLSEAYYLPVNSIQGAAALFDFGQMFAHGGELAAMASWTLDAGDGVDDKFVIAGSEGDILIYDGTDPSSASTFGLVGRWFIGKVPDGRRFMSKYAGDLAILCEAGLQFMSRVQQARGLTDPVDPAEDTTARRFSQVIGETVAATRGEEFWSLIWHSPKNALMITTPYKTKSVGLQYCLTSIQNAYSTMSRMPMACAETFGGEFFFGTEDGTICKGFTGDSDDFLTDGTEGTQPVASIQTAFVAPGGDGMSLKIPYLAQVLILSPEPPMLNVQVNTEWSNADTPGAPPYVPNTNALWDVAKWDQAVWGGAANTYLLWIGVQGLGSYMSLRMSILGKPGTIFTGWKIIYQPGGPM